MTPLRHEKAKADRCDIAALADRLACLAVDATVRGEALAARNLSRVAKVLRREAERPVPEVTPARPRPSARAPKASHPWRSSSVLPAKGHGGGT